MPSFEDIVKVLYYFDQTDKILAFGGLILLFIGIIANIDIRGTTIKLDQWQRVLAIGIGMIVIILAILPKLISFSKQTVTLADLLDLKYSIDTTQQIVIRGLTDGNGSEGDRCYYARKELPFASDWNSKSQSKINVIISKIQK